MIRILHSADFETILNFERSRVVKLSDDLEQEMAEWHAPWRREALEHYLNLGWSFGDFDADDRLRGYFLAQPILFVRGMTQSLWVEHLHANSEELRKTLLDVAYRTCREKHFQTLLLRDPQGVSESAREDKIFEIKTAKF